MNVAVTRAKRQCILICDSGTVNHDKFLKGLTNYFKTNGLNRSSFDYQGNPDVRIMYGEKVSNIKPEVKAVVPEEEEKGEKKEVEEDQKASDKSAKQMTHAERKKLKKEQ
jgi:hypothetical protein